jgi:tripartite-type tricarboxylate transporter receptor subunit TctC
MTPRDIKPSTYAAMVGLALALPATTGTALAAGDSAYYKGKTVTYIVATSPGGGYDFYGRLIAQFMEKNLPGSKFVVVNKPGGGHKIGANLIYHSKPTGRTIGIFNTGLIYSQVIGQKGIRFDLSKMSWIGKAAADPRVVMVAAQSPFKKLSDLTTAKTPIKFSSSGVGTSGYNDTQMLAKVLNWNFKMILGYRGSGSELAMRRGEIHAAVGSLSSAALFVKNGYGRILAQIGGKPETNAPMLSNVVKSADAKAIAALIGSQAGLARFTAGPPNIPAGRLEALRAAYKKSFSDPVFLKQAKKADRPIDPLFGDDVTKGVIAALNQPPEVVKLVRAILNVKAPSSKVTTKLGSVSPDGRNITFKVKGKMLKSKVSGSRTKIKVGGKKAKRKALKPGMSCVIDYKPGGRNEPKTIDCK